MQIYDIILKYNQHWSEFEMRIFLTLFAALSLVLLICMICKKINFVQALATLGLYIFLVIVAEATIFSRPEGGYYGYEPELFWSWKLAAEGNRKYLEYIVLNIALLVPVGVLLPFIFNHRFALWKSMIIGFLISLSIETTQLRLKRGIFEWDDILHNTIGCILGTLVINIIWFICEKIWKLIKKRKEKKKEKI